MSAIKPSGLQFGGLGDEAIHLCVDMQRLFTEPSPWQTPWMPRVLPVVAAVAGQHPDRLAFTRFIPLERPEHGAGTWRRYYERWQDVTLEKLDPDLLDLMPELQRYAPPAPVFDKRVYSPWFATNLHARLRSGGCTTLIVTGGETEVCVLSTVMGAIDLGYRVVLVTDALCSSADETHDAVLDIYHGRFGMQVEAVESDELLEAWR